MPRTLLALALCTLPTFGHAIQVRELDGQFINPANGNMLAGKAGLMHCREGEGSSRKALSAAPAQR
ncbi:MAG TPA: hypothetical protein VFL64_08025 [Rhizobacter sp.]|nr:hypothetical protein [Rhizobacter sp.]